MKNSLLSALAVLLVFTAVGHADARRRRRRAKKKAEPVYTITGRVRASIDYKTRTDVHKKLNRLRRFKSRAYWRFYDPLAIIMNRIPLSERLVVFVQGVTQVPPKSPEASEVRVKGGGIFPPLIIQHMSTDLSVYNAHKKKVSIFSPGRVVEKKELKPEIISPRSESVFNISPREHESADKKISFWSWPLRLKEYPAARSRIVFLRSYYYSRVADSGVYTIDNIPAGKYKLVFMYVDKIVKEIPITVKKKRRGRRRGGGIQYMKTVALSLPLLTTY